MKKHLYYMEGEGNHGERGLYYFGGRPNNAETPLLSGRREGQMQRSLYCFWSGNKKKKAKNMPKAVVIEKNSLMLWYVFDLVNNHLDYSLEVPFSK